MILTLSLKLHNPSKNKINLIDGAIKKYSNGINALLEKAEFSVPKSKKDQWACVYDFLKANLNTCPKPFRDSIQKDFTAIVMKDFAKGAEVKPIKCSYVYFCRYNGQREYALFFHKEKKRYYAKLQILSMEDNALLPHLESNSLEMVGGDFVLKNRHPRYILVPLSFGKRQEELIKQIRDGQVKPKTAQLIKKRNGYFLDMTLEVSEPPTKTNKTYLSITRTLKHYFHYSLCSKYGDIIDHGFIEKVNDDCEENMHVIANTFIKMALRHNSRFIIEKLASRNDNVSVNSIVPKISIKEYLRFAEILKYKSRLRGLLDPVMLAPTRLFLTCPMCMKATRNNRMSEDIFLCTGCGYAGRTEEIGSLNLINKLFTYRANGIAIEKRKVHNGFVYVNRMYKIAWICKSDQDFYDRIEKLKNATEYDKIYASLKKKLENIENGCNIELM